MISEQDPMLESDHLDELLERPAPAQPVVVVEYRSRGVPSWVFFPLIIVVPLGTLYAYHRMVVERDRIQVARANAQLEREIIAERAAQPLVRNDPPSTTVLPTAGANAVVVTTSADPAAPRVVTPPQSPTTAALEKTALAPAALASKDEATTTPGTAPPSAPVAPTVVTAVAADRPPLAPENMPQITTRTNVPNPFADDAGAPEPPAPGEAGGVAANRDRTDTTPAAPAQAASAPGPDKSPAAPARDVVNATGRPVPPGQGSPPPGQGPDPAAAAGAPAVAGPVVATAATTTVPIAPLPTKEETLRQIEEEAARKQAELLAQNDTKNAELRAQRFEEQTRFRTELEEVIRTQGNRAGPEIETLAKRYGYEFNPDTYARAQHYWHYTRNTQKDKVKFIRSLDLPETVILNFISDDIYRTMMLRNGPRTPSELRVRAAKQLLKYPLTNAGAVERAAAGSNTAAGPQPASRGAVISTPR
jgi:hypothetical protein